MKKGKQRIYWRSQGAERRAYADFRDYAYVGDGQEALVVPGEKRATTDQRAPKSWPGDDWTNWTRFARGGSRARFTSCRSR